MNKALNNFIFQSKYSRFNPKLNRKETFKESVDRIQDMHLKHFETSFKHVLTDATFMNDFIECIQAYENQEVFGSQRGLQFGGDPILNKHCRIYNCAATYADRLEVFKEVEWVLLCGTGCGISVEKQHVDKIPKMMSYLNTENFEYVIEDSIEGWAYAIQAIIDYYFKGTKYPKFNYDKIRSQGSYISGGFVAPGPEGLKKAIRKIEELLQRVYNTTKKLSPLNVTDMLCFCADSVLSGGLRRSAMIILFDPYDQEMYNCKTGNWYKENPQRARFNASAVLERDSTSREIFTNLFQAAKQFGEPGFFWRSNPGLVPNPCVEVGMYPVDIITSKTGFQFCNLVSISGKSIKTENDFYIACKNAATLATIQASYMKFDFLGEVTENIVKADPLIGISIGGIMCNPDILLNAEILNMGAEIVKEQNLKIANILGINRSSRCTVIKPDGNFSVLTGNSPGCHGEHARHYIRRVQVNKDEEAGIIYKKENPKSVVESVWSNNKTDNCIMFPITADDSAILKSELLGVKQLEIVKFLQNNWIRAGKVDRNSELENNVSNTIQVPDDAWEEVENYIWDNRFDIAGVSTIPESGDLEYNQPAYSEVLMPQELLDKYGKGIIFASGLIVDALEVFGDLWVACETFKGRGEHIFTTLDEAIKFIDSFNVAKYEDFLDKPLKEWNAAKVTQYKKWVDLLVEIGYTEDFAEQLIDNEVPIPSTEIQKYLDNKLFGYVENLASKRDVIRRMRKYADKYYDGETSTMINALKHVQLYHDWCDITNSYKEIDWSKVQWKNVLIQADTTGAAACGGGACEITKI